MSRQLASKWRKTAALMKYPVAAVHIPQTKAFNSGNLLQMLSRYGMVYVKPIVGGGGYGVIRVSASGGAYRYTHMKTTRSFTSFSQMYRSLVRVKARRKYLIQQGIHLATIQGRPVDYRVKVVKTATRLGIPFFSRTTRSSRTLCDESEQGWHHVIRKASSWFIPATYIRSAQTPGDAFTYTDMYVHYGKSVPWCRSAWI